MDRLESMSTLLAAVETGSLSAASRKLGMPLATVSRKVSELEAHLRTRLVNRTSRRLTLTEAGRAYVAACKRILDDIGEAERAASGEYAAPRGDLVIAAPIVFGRLHVLPVVIAFLKTYPDIDVRLTLADSVVNLQEHDVDLAVRIGELPDSSLVATRVGAIRRVVCGSPDYFAARGTPKRPDDLTKHDCITFHGLTAPDHWQFREGKSALSVPIHSRLTVNTAEAAIDAAIASVGVTRVLGYQVAGALRSGTLALVLEAFEPAPWPVSLVHAGQGLLPLKLRAFIDFAGPLLKAQLAA
ncbi:MAG: LysR family transcriptional regulator [Xanthobacteraceae bacterium]|nr:LysR family transcriptional regulator [Xanthobacteraceae bacterium]